MRNVQLKQVKYAIHFYLEATTGSVYYHIAFSFVFKGAQKPSSSAPPRTKVENDFIVINQIGITLESMTSHRRQIS